MITSEPTAEALTSTPRPSRHRRRTALWISLSVGVLLALLIAVLASSPPASQVLTESPLLGHRAPAIVGAAIVNGPPGGAPVRLADDRGRWVLVNFAASWCTPCQEEMPQLLLFAGEHSARHDATILSVAYDEGEISNFRHFLLVRHVSWQAVDESAAKVDYGVAGGIPESYLIDPAGTVVAVVEGQVKAANLDALIARYSPAEG